jgi:hypothetical protein
VSAIDTHRDAAEVVHREGPTHQAPGWCIRCTATQHPSHGPLHLPFGTVEVSIGPVVPVNRGLIVVIKNEPALRSVASHQKQGHDRPAVLVAPLVAGLRRTALSRRPSMAETFAEVSGRVEAADEP